MYWNEEDGRNVWFALIFNLRPGLPPVAQGGRRRLMGLLFASWAAAEIASSERGPTVGLVSFGAAALWTARQGGKLWAGRPRQRVKLRAKLLEGPDNHGCEPPIHEPHRPKLSSMDLGIFVPAAA
jgi:hypothetical protein